MSSVSDENALVECFGCLVGGRWRGGEGVRGHGGHALGGGGAGVRAEAVGLAAAAVAVGVEAAGQHRRASQPVTVAELENRTIF